MKKPSEKGGDFERLICVKLSEWWTGDKRNDIFWRVAGSGGRATNRGKKQLSTAGGCGDITFTDPIGAPLLKFTTIELKRGYKDFHPGMFFDIKDKWWNTEWWKFVHQAQQSALLAKTPFWWLIGKRDFKRAVIYFPYTLQQLTPTLQFGMAKYPIITINPPHITGEDIQTPITGMDFEEFLESFDRDDVIDLLNPMIDDVDLS